MTDLWQFFLFVKTVRTTTVYSTVYTNCIHNIGIITPRTQQNLRSFFLTPTYSNSTYLIQIRFISHESYFSVSCAVEFVYKAQDFGSRQLLSYVLRLDDNVSRKHVRQKRKFCWKTDHLNVVFIIFLGRILQR